MVNGLENNALAALTKNASKPVLNAIKAASVKTGVDFAYLVQQAQTESNFNPDIKAKTSSATGLYQFINSTWLNVIESYGDKYGIDTEGKTDKEILELRKDPEIAANMAAEFAGENERYLNNNWGGDVGSTELYLAHFLGAPNAAGFLNARDDNGLKPAAVIFPKAAKSNYNVFYDAQTGRAKSLDEVYAFFDEKFEIEDIDPETIMINNAVQIAELAVEKTKTSPLVLEDKKPSSLVYERQPGSTYSPLPYFQLVQSPVQLMLLSQLDLPLNGDKNSFF